MIRRLVYLLTASLASYGGLYLIYRRYLADIVPIASSDGPQSLWRFEAAFVVTAVMWMSLAVSVLSAFFLGLLLMKRLQDRQGPGAIRPGRRKVPGAGLR